MIEKVVKKQNLEDHKSNSIIDDLEYWLAKTPEERVSTVEFLRRQYHGRTARLQRLARVIKQIQR